LICHQSFLGFRWRAGVSLPPTGEGNEAHGDREGGSAHGEESTVASTYVAASSVFDTSGPSMTSDLDALVGSLPI
jgi:hypothetical protein